MLLQATLSLLIQQSNTSLPPKVVENYAHVLADTAERHDLDPLLLEAIVHIESRYKANAIHYENDGSCSVGLGQINVRECTPGVVDRLTSPTLNLERAAFILVKAKEICPKVRKNCAKLGWVGLYNPGDRTYSSRIRQTMKEHRAIAKSAVREVRSELYVPELSGQASDGTSAHCRVGTRKCCSFRPLESGLWSMPALQAEHDAGGGGT